MHRPVVVAVVLDVVLPEGLVPHLELLRQLVRRHLLHLQDDDPGHDDAGDVDEGQQEAADGFGW